MANPIGDKATDKQEPTYYNRDFWGTENLKYVKVHFRMAKAARIVRRLADGRECDLLDLGCGPGTLGRLLPGSVRYHGIDIAIQEPAPNLIEMDLLQSPIGFRDMKFDIIVAQGVFEYFGDRQAQKFAEIRSLLRPGGRFVVTYMNFAHHKRELYWPYSNVQQPAEFRRDLERSFVIERTFPGAYNWNQSLPNRPLMKAAQINLNVDIPVLSTALGVDRFYICSPRPVR
jgi:cyclopropane fatty-acyl-phospholipid synthase-like methyltransferase